MIGIELVYNLALLVALSVVSSFIVEHWRERRYGALLQGLLFGGVAVIGMLHPLNFSEGIIFDGRSTVISIAALFFGPIAAAVSGGMAIVCRILQGGVGAFTGVLVILSSAAIGIVFHRRRSNKLTPISISHLLFFGLLVHVTMLLLMYTLPFDKAIQTMQQVGLLILTIYPLATVLIGKILSDAVSRKRLIADLHESEEKYRTLTENIRDVVWTLDAETLRFTYVSPSVIRLRGYTPEEVMAMPFDEALMPPFNEWVKIGLRQRLAEISEGKRDPESFEVSEVEQPCKDGTTIWTEVIANYYLNEQTGHVEVRGVSRDITERKKAEDALQKSRESYKTLAENLPDLVYRVHLREKGRMEFFNDRVKKFTGRSEQELRKGEVCSIEPDIHPEDISRVVSTVAQAIEKGGAFEVSYRYLHKDGRILYFYEHGQTIKDANGNPHYIDGIIQDITERKQAEKRMLDQRKRYHELLIHQHVGLLVVGVDERVELVNQEFYDLLGLEGAPADLIGLTPAETLSRILPAYSDPADMLERVKKVVSANRRFTNEEILLRNGRIVMVDFHPIIIDGVYRGRMWAHRDITEIKEAEKKLRESEERYRLIAENTADYIVVRDLSLKSIYVSPSIEKVKGFSPDEFLSLNMDQIMTPASLALVRQVWAEEEVLEKSGTADSDRKRVLVLEEYCKDGSSRFVEKTLSYLRDHTGKPQGILSVSRDVTERRKAEEAVRDSEAKYRTLLDDAALGIGFWTVEGRLLFLNREGASRLGGLPEHFVGSTMEELFGKEPASRYVARLKEAAESDHAIFYEDEVLLPMGKRWYRSSYRCAVHSDGIITGIQIISDDISEKKQAEEGLRESERSLRATIDGLSANIAVLDEDGTIMLVNKAWRNFAEKNGIPAGKVSEGSNYLHICDSAAGDHSQEAAPFAQGIRDVLSGKSDRFSMEYPCSSPDSVRWFVGRVTLFPGDGPRRVVVAHENYTKRKLLALEREELIKALQDKNDEMESMLYASSHDLRTPLVSIMGFNSLVQHAIKDLSLLLDKDRPAADICAEARPIITEKLPTASTYIGKSAEKMQALVDGILKLSRLGRATHSPEMIDMNALVRRALATLDLQKLQAHAAVTVGDLPPCWGDPRELEQAFTNIIDNAVKYRDPARPLTIAITGSLAGHCSRYDIADNGIGMKPGHYDQIWGLFARLEPNGPVPDEGIGLAMVKRIVQRNRGKIEVESERGKGSVFHLSLPGERQNGECDTTRKG